MMIKKGKKKGERERKRKKKEREKKGKKKEKEKSAKDVENLRGLYYELVKCIKEQSLLSYSCPSPIETMINPVSYQSTYLPRTSNNNVNASLFPHYLYGKPRGARGGNTQTRKLNPPHPSISSTQQPTQRRRSPQD